MSKLIIVGLGCALGSVAFAQNLVSDPGFEDSATLTGTAWTMNNAASGSDWFVSSNNAAVAHSGLNCLEFGATGTLDDTVVQNLTTVAGHGYTYSFWFYGGGPTEDLNVFWNGNNIFSTTTPTDGAYHQYSFNVTATSTTTQIGIGALNGPSFSRLDDVSVAGAVPEPASMAVLGIGALALLRRRRSAK